MVYSARDLEEKRVLLCWQFDNSQPELLDGLYDSDELIQVNRLGDKTVGMDIYKHYQRD